jgi:outer membrane protein
MIITLNKNLLGFLFLTLFSTYLWAGEISRDIRAGTGPEYGQEDGGYADLGFGFQTYSGQEIKGSEISDIHLTVNLNMGYQWQGYFVEALSDSQYGLVLGYNALNTSNWTLDAVFGPENDGTTREEYDDLAPLRDRYLDLTAGIRATGYFGQTIIQLQLRNEILTNLHNGYSALFTVGRSWQIRNANLHALVSYQHQSASTVDYYWGVKSTEANDEFPQYTASAANTFSSEVGLTYPINETWIIRSKLSVTRVDEDISNSPLLQTHKRNSVLSTVTLNYVF